MIKKTLEVAKILVPSVVGHKDTHIRMINSEFSVNVSVLGGAITIEGKAEDVRLAAKVLEEMIKIAAEDDLDTSKTADIIRMVSDNTEDAYDIMKDGIPVSGRVKKVAAKSAIQRDYVNAIRNNDMVFGIGPAGTGKTYLAMAMGVHYFLRRKYGKIILTRPAVEAGENLGFLPGDISDKINPYLRPLYDAMYSMMDYGRVNALIEDGIIEVAPLAFMRGRTLNDAFIILDEAQNTTEEQMKMFLTRMGFQSKVVITGDITQIDLPTSRNSGLVQARKILGDVNGIKFVQFTEKDVVRNTLVQKIVQAYDKFHGDTH
ncbi:PhoH family protein [Seleniivibrio woodruffii]|uniref:PhoH-like protein n=1 Tax=Seleniivibrio woodruffii TaxID=1078050 RepID=A0A4R1K9I2_9BACT|nr:PhoH family protein [Seleniivibrio woodruffii]TCK60690.1 phosphate starvation-inducible protein PhoH [Seleniivibrio woodruffii]TVZ36320.1 phosphate starvation-inducible protein PhoH [Seleniivibrio woodruffii]